MLYYAPVFLVVGVIAGALNLVGVSALRSRFPGYCSWSGSCWSRSMSSQGAPVGLRDWWTSGCPTVSRRDDLTPL